MPLMLHFTSRKSNNGSLGENDAYPGLPTGLMLFAAPQANNGFRPEPSLGVVKLVTQLMLADEEH